VLCDLRAIFKRFPSASTSDEYERDVKLLLGFEPIILVSLGLNDTADNNTVATFQLTEKNLHSLIKTLQDALAQVETAKLQQKNISAEEAP
jgi:hypothetical protein